MWGRVGPGDATSYWRSYTKADKTSICPVPWGSLLPSKKTQEQSPTSRSWAATTSWDVRLLEAGPALLARPFCSLVGLNNRTHHQNQTNLLGPWGSEAEQDGFTIFYGRQKKHKATVQITTHTYPPSWLTWGCYVSPISHPALVLPSSRLNLFKYPIIELSPLPDRFQSMANAHSPSDPPPSHLTKAEIL